ncbi:biotin synthase [Thermococcus profundus]|uniref:Biotin synthase n=1 Tax=Thermococcus profundus TaxID=49899 RepID=A0A2Z2MEB1_THEPR|nr:radical SAM protein [Thermococcus profundus]ASJ02975.1 biotin synthase [Thermococcus profundus]
MVEMIRVSYGTAIAMGLIKAKALVKPTTAYMMTYWPGHCRNNCAFCAQARGSRANLEKLSRITWPAFDLEEVIDALPAGKFARICLQTVDYPGMVDEVLELLEYFRPLGLPISVSITPVDRGTLEELKSLGVDYIGVGLDAASERVYESVKDSLYSWSDMWEFTGNVVDVFGKGKALVHLIIGLGESDREAVETMEKAYSMGADVSLFAFTPIKGTAMENHKTPSLARYRRIQIARYLLEKGLSSLEDFQFDSDGNLQGFGVSMDELKEILPPSVFSTHGCPGCNRPYYNERPREEPYNFPVVPERGYVERILKALL